MAHQHRFWSEDKTKMLLELRAARIPIAAIAARLGVTYNAAKSRLRIFNAFKRINFRWTPEYDARLAAYYRKPKSERGPLKIELRSWPESPTPDAAYLRASRLELTKESTVINVNEIKRRQECVLAALQQENNWVNTKRIIASSNLSYDIIRPVLTVLLNQGLVEFRLGMRGALLWKLAGLSAFEQTARLKALEQQRINCEQNKVNCEYSNNSHDLNEHKTWMEAVAQQKAWRKQMAALVNRR